MMPRRQNTLNFLIDLITALVMLAMIATGLVMRYVLPPGSGGRGGGRGLVLWDLDRHDWGDVHFWLAVTVAALLVLHVALHWRWVCTTVRRVLRPGGEPAAGPASAARNLYGAGFLAALVLLIGGFLWVAQLNVQSVGGEGGGRGQGRHAGQEQPLALPDAIDTSRERSSPHANVDEHAGSGSDIRGSMTLQEVADYAGLTADRLKELLGLPADVPADERLGRLKRQYGLEMADVRRIVSHNTTTQQPSSSDDGP